MKSKKNTFVSRAAVGCVTTAIFLLLCIIKGIYPFGIATLDTVDFQSQWIPAYYHVWDVLHGDGSAFFDWRVGGGNNFAGVSAQFSLFSPFNLFFLFVKRSWIEKSMIVFLLIKLLAMGYGMRWFLKEQILKEERYGIYILAGSVGYAVNGYTLLYYGMGWLDVAAILPLLCYFFCRMAEREGDWRLGKNTLGYIVCLTLVFLINIPQAYMMCFFLIVFAGGYFFLKRQDQPLKKNGILKFGLTSLLSLGIAAVIFLPAARAMLGSYRLSGEEYRGISGYFLLLRQDGMDAVWKWVILGSVAVPLLFFVISGRRKREHIWQWYLVAAMVLPVFFEAVNLIWHRGTYVCFPMRYGYMLVFAVICMAAARVPDFVGDSRVRRNILYAFLGIWCVQMVALGISLIQPETHTDETDFVGDATEIGQPLAGKTDVFHKAKLADGAIDNNYPLIAESTSYSNYLHLMTSEQIRMNTLLGYSQVWTRLSDTGGTLASDIMLGYRYYVASKAGSWGKDTAADSLWPLAETEKFTLWENAPVGDRAFFITKADYEAYVVTEAYTENVFENQNRLSELLFHTVPIDWKKETYLDDQTGAELSYRFYADGKQILYLYGKDLQQAEITVNGERLYVPDYNDLYNESYPATGNQGILSLGCFSDEDITVEIRQSVGDSGAERAVFFGFLDPQELLEAVDTAGRSVTYELDRDSCKLTVESAGEEYLMLPINADGGWHCTVNGEERAISRLAGNLMLVPLDAGTNEITLCYVPRGMKKGAAVTGMALMLLAGWGFLSRLLRRKSVLDKIYAGLGCAAADIFAVVYAGFLLVVYVIPVVYTIYLRWI